VDDEVMLRRAVTRVLRGAGAVAVCAGTHDQAIMLLAFEPLLDLAILDFHMPDGDVGNLVRRLLMQRPDLTVVGTSALDRRSEFAARGIDTFLPKPWSLHDLLLATGSRRRPAGLREPKFPDSPRSVPASGDGLPAATRQT
jgi:CheY-like chemotaxis protein